MKASPMARSPPPGMGFDRAALFGTVPTPDTTESYGEGGAGGSGGTFKKGGGNAGSEGGNSTYQSEEISSDQRDIMLQIEQNDQRFVRIYFWLLTATTMT